MLSSASIATPEFTTPTSSSPATSASCSVGTVAASPRTPFSDPDPFLTPPHAPPAPRRRWRVFLRSKRWTRSPAARPPIRPNRGPPLRIRWTSSREDLEPARGRSGPFSRIGAGRWVWRRIWWSRGWSRQWEC
ncbi:unnamed protein product [Linum tenue]|uniref:Uncharacterized protein n=1 Tax=Linum tenue TaxID=586396 RepID=A0AAV0Q2W6_9ROSI|nr:unnamed protein product [Linum tenue]